MSIEKTKRFIFAHFGGLILITMVACNGSGTSQEDGSMVKTSLGNTHFSISLPSGYSLKSQQGPDFTVYFFSPVDSTNIRAYSGGLYFGNFPQLFGPPLPTCETGLKQNEILGDTAKWTVFSCDSIFSAQTIVMSNSKEEWNKQIHAFGKAANEDDLGKLIKVFGTLTQEKH